MSNLSSEKDIGVIDPVKTGQFIKKIRLELDMSQRELASKVYLTRKAVSKWETGKSCPSLDVIKRLAVILHATIEEICEGEFKDSSRNDDNRTPFKKIIDSKIFKVSILVILIFLVAGIFITYNDRRTIVYSINTLSDDFYLMNASIVKSGDSEIINFGNFQCDLKDVNEDTIYNFDFYIKGNDKEELLFSYSYNPLKDNTIINSKKILSIITKYKDNIYLRVSYYNVSRELKVMDTKINIKLLKKYSTSFDYSKYSELEEINKLETKPVVGTGNEQELIDISFIFEMTEEELVRKYSDVSYTINGLVYKVYYERNQFYIIQGDMRLSINIKTLKAIFKNGMDITYLNVINGSLNLSIMSSDYRNNLKSLFLFLKK